MRVAADLTFWVALHDGSGAERRRPAQTVTGTVTADGADITVRFSRTPSLAGSGTRPVVRPLAQALDRHGLQVRLVGPTGPVLRLGRGVRAPWWQVPATGSRRVRVDSVWRALAGWRGPRLFEAALPPMLVLPTTALTAGRRARRRLAAAGLVRRLSRRRR